MVKGKYPTYNGNREELPFSLIADQGFNPFTWAPPINWKGVVGGYKVSFVQTSHSGYSIEDYDFEGFPEEVVGAIPYIVETIDKAMKTMD